jgi:hypothetical protein
MGSYVRRGGLSMLWGPNNLRLNGYCRPLTGTKWLRHCIDHSPPSSVEVKDDWSYTSTPVICLHGRNSNTFTFHLAQKKVHYLALPHERFTRKFYWAFSGVQATQ